MLRSHPKLLAVPLSGGLSGAAVIATLLGGLYTVVPFLQKPSPAMYAALVAATRTVFNGDEPPIWGTLANAW